MSPDARLRRLNLGCGPRILPGWINADRRPAPGVAVCGDFRDGLPLADGGIDYAVAMHLLQDFAWGDIPPLLADVRRVLKPGGILRIGVPDLDRAIDAYRRGDAAYFHVPDRDAVSLGAKLVTQIIWYGSVRTPFTWGYAEEVLRAAGYARVVRCDYGRTASDWPDIATLDNRERESLYVEATR